MSPAAGGHEEKEKLFHLVFSVFMCVRIVGILLFSKETGELCFLAVDPTYRRQHIAQRLVSFMLTQMDADQDITVTTYREDDPDGQAAWSFYKRLGFSEGKLTEAFGHPVQEFILKRQSCDLHQSRRWPSTAQ